MSDPVMKLPPPETQDEIAATLHAWGLIAALPPVAQRRAMAWIESKLREDRDEEERAAHAE